VHFPCEEEISPLLEAAGILLLSNEVPRKRIDVCPTLLVEEPPPPIAAAGGCMLHRMSLGPAMAMAMAAHTTHLHRSSKLPPPIPCSLKFTHIKKESSTMM
jgi:hypothetical protein